MMHLLFYGLTLSLHLLPLFLCVKFDNPNQMHIHAITILIGDMTPFSYYAVGPTLDVAFKRLQHDYPTTFANMSRTIIHEPGALSCADGAALVPALSDKIYEAVQRYPNSFTVMFSPGCSLEIVALGDFAREWDIPLFASSSSDGALSDKQRYPTVMSFTSSDEVATFVSFQLFLGRYRWRTITLLCDAPSQFQALSTFYMVACRNIKRFLDGSTTTKFLTNKLEFDSVKTLDYATLLSRVQDQSRVQVICAHPRIVRDIMVTAKRLNMTNGDYIFFTFQTTRVPGMTEILWQFLDDNDEAAFDGFQSLISFQNPNPKWELISDILEEAKNNSLDRYNRSVSRNEQLNDLAISGYESVLAFAQVFLELRADINTLTGTSFARRFYNRSFNPCFRNFFINENGMRMNDAVYQRLNVDSGVLEDTWLYDFASSVLREVSPKLAHTWKSKDGPPPDVPQCGYRNDLCATSNTQTLIISGVLVAVAVIICIGLTTALYWKFSNKMSNKSPWWQLHYTDLQPLSNPGPAWIMVRQRLPEAELSVCTNRRLHHGQSVTIEPFYGKCLSVHQILEQATFRNVLYATRFLQHENVNRFVGIATSSSPAYSYMVFDYGARDTLRLLIQNEPIHMDHTLKSSMIWEIVHGLKYLHRSSLQYHGALSSIIIMIDQRFCLKISSYALSKFRGKLYGSIFPAELPLDPSVLWAAPEIISGASVKVTKESDMYSLGVVISEIFTGRAPMQTNFASVDSVQENVAVLRKDPTVIRIVDTSKLPAELHHIVDACTANNHLERPTMPRFTEILSQVIPCKKMIDLILPRLDMYSSHLEDLVEARTRQLVDERSKVDSLLREMLPELVVNSLRNKHTVVAEYFECVTLSFSDIPQFGSVVVQCAPLQTIVLLNAVYSVFDSILPRFDVYKVETIGDSYLLASGLPIPNGSRHAGEIARMTLSMLQAAESIPSPIDPTERLQLRVGIHSGYCAAGVVGLRMPRYCLFGDTINTASRMESQGAASKIHVSETTKNLLDQIGGFEFESRGSIMIKGKGEMVTFWLRQ